MEFKNGIKFFSFKIICKNIKRPFHFKIPEFSRRMKMNEIEFSKLQSN